MITAYNQMLKGLNVLVTRPKAQVQPWSQILLNCGAKVSTVPMLAIKPIADNKDNPAKQEIIYSIQRLNEYQKAIFVSQNAVSYGIDWIDNYWPQLPRGLEFFAVGKTTAEQLQKHLTHWGGGCSIS